MIGFNQINLEQINSFRRLAIRTLAIGALIVYAKTKLHNLLFKGK